MLKYFCEEAPEYHIAAAVSLLGVAVSREKYSFPVGKVMIRTLYPLNFDEFLKAVGKGYFVERIQEHYESMQEISAAVHQEIFEWYYRYLYIGGMPAAINEYMNRGNLPLIAFRDVASFKLYLSDVGLLSAFAGITPESIIQKRIIRSLQRKHGGKLCGTDA